MSESQVTPEAAATRKPEHEIMPVLLNRWSPRAFAAKDIPENVLYRLFEAARWAPSGSNEQPWRYIIARKPEDRERFLSFINPFNTEWCAQAPVLVLALSKKTTSKGSPSSSYAFDAGAAWGYLALEGVAQGLITHAMGGFNRQQAIETLGIPEEYEPLAVIAIGYRGDPASLSERNREREVPSTRRPLEELLLEGSFTAKP
ncbi:nitroreductase family protein [Paenibacillus sp. MBLB4367]|uniref:nitroreductase family protein n=1 Tax=Paenibacillus sp. MBLB4367 TaxID=3384767 RepID=UPI0039083DDA